MAAPLDDAALDTLFHSARTYNGFYDKPVSEAQLRAIYDLVRMGPTSANCQPLRILWCVSQESKDKLSQYTSGSNAVKVQAAPVTAILGMDMEFYNELPRLFPHDDARSWFAGNAEVIEKTAFRNSTLQGAYFIMAARAIGLDTGPMSGFDNAAVDAAFFAGTPVKSNFLCTIGYGDPATIFDRSPRPTFEEFTKVI